MRKIGRYRRKKQKKILIIGSLSLLLFLCVGYAAFSTNLSITAKGNIKEKSRVIQSWNDTSQTDFHSDFYKQNIVSVTFLDNNTVPNSATESWNVSEDKEHGGVMAWVIPNNNDNTKYDLYIGAKGGVIANEDSSFLFRNFRSVVSIDFNDNFNTENVENMSYLFDTCTNLLELNISGFDTSNVISMLNMFTNCESLSNLDLSNFDIRKVNNVSGMFGNCTNLKNVEFNINYIASSVIYMNNMFLNCNSLESINLCNFDTHNVVTMNQMFQGTPNLKNVYVGPNWTTENATTENIFAVSGISSVTIDQC